MDTSQSRSEIPGKVCIVLLEMDEEVKKSEEGNILYPMK